MTEETRAGWVLVPREPTEAMERGAFEAEGWSVAVHNDYRLNGQRMTFWLFTHPDGRYTKGEGVTDKEALTAAWQARAARTTDAVAREAAWQCACGWRGNPAEMTPTPAGGLACPTCGGTGGLEMAVVDARAARVPSGGGFDYAAYKASLPPELQKYVPTCGPINGVPIDDVAEMLARYNAELAAIRAIIEAYGALPPVLKSIMAVVEDADLPNMRGPAMKTQYEPKTERQHLGYLAEEAGEVLAAVGKSLRWGLDSYNPEIPESEREANADWLWREMDDLQNAIQRMRGWLHNNGHPALARLTSARRISTQEDGWLPIETAPKDGTAVLLCYERTEYLPEPWPLVIIAHWAPELTGQGCWVWQGRSARGYGVDPIGWQPLPAPKEPQS